MCLKPDAHTGQQSFLMLFAHPHGHVCVKLHCRLYNVQVFNTHRPRLLYNVKARESVGCRHRHPAMPATCHKLFQHNIIQLSNHKQLCTRLELSGSVMQANTALELWRWSNLRFLITFLSLLKQLWQPCKALTCLICVPPCDTLCHLPLAMMASAAVGFMQTPFGSVPRFKADFGCN